MVLRVLWNVVMISLAIERTRLRQTCFSVYRHRWEERRLASVEWDADPIRLPTEGPAFPRGTAIVPSMSSRAGGAIFPHVSKPGFPPIVFTRTLLCNPRYSG